MELSKANAQAPAPRATDTPAWQSFSAAEMARRVALARRFMGERQLRALVVFGTSANNGAAMANAFWLSNYLDLHQCYLVVPYDEQQEPALYIGLRNHLPSAREVSDVTLIQWGGYDPAATVATRLRELGVTRGAVGLVGVNPRLAIGMPYAHHSRLREALPGIELPDVTAQFQRLRAVKSQEEVALLRRAAALTDSAMLAIAEQSQPGTSEVELVAAAEGAYRSEGAMPRITFLRSMPMDEPNGCVPAQSPSRRRLRAGDVVITEVSASYGGYAGQVHRPVFVGAEPALDWQRMFEVAREGYLAVAEAMRPGASEADIVAAAEPIRGAGYGIYDDLVHGYGVDIMPPVIDRDQFDGRAGAGAVRIERNMAIVIQPNPITRDERMGLQLGGLAIVTEGGAESLHRVPLEPLIAPSR